MWFSGPWPLPRGNAVAMPWCVYIVASLTASTTASTHPARRVRKKDSMAKEKESRARTGFSASQRTRQRRAERAPGAVRAVRV